LEFGTQTVVFNNLLDHPEEFSCLIFSGWFSVIICGCLKTITSFAASPCSCRCCQCRAQEPIAAHRQDVLT